MKKIKFPMKHKINNMKKETNKPYNKTLEEGVKKEYEFSGVIDYAHCFTFTIKAKNKREAKELAKIRAKKEIDPAMAEYQTTLIDEPIEIK